MRTATHPLVFAALVTWASGLAAVTCAAQTTSPAPDDPRPAARAVLRALAEKDAAAVRALIDVPTEDHAPLADAVARLLVAGRRLADSATAKFGVAGGEQLGAGPITPADASTVDDARVEAGRESADVLLPGQTLPLKFVRRGDGAWRLSIAHYHGGRPENVADQAALLRMMADALDESATEIEQDRYATADDAEAAIKQKLNFVLMRKLNPAAAAQPAPAAPPATRPTTRPGA